MANFGRVKTWGNETLTASDLNAEFDNIINNVTSGSVSSANIDLTDGYAWTGAHTFAVDLKVLNGAGVIVGNTAQVTTSSAGEFQVLGTAAADSTAIIGHWAAAASGGTLSFVKSRNATIGSSTIVVDNDLLGTIEFMGDDGSDFATPAASIFSRVNGTPGANDMPGELVLAVTADAGNSVTERVRILQNGTVEMNSGTLSFDGAASIDTSGNAILSLSAGTADIQVTASNLTPASNDGSALGVSGTAWSDLFLASGSVVNWVAGDITLTHSAGKLTFGGDGAVEIDFNNHEMTNIDVNSGAIDGATIGAASAAAGTFTTITGSGNISFDGGSFVFNESGADKDFRIEGDTEANLFMADASTDRIGIGVAAPLANLHVQASDVSVSPGGYADNFIIEENGDAGMSIISGTSSRGSIQFGDTTAAMGEIQYKHGDNYLSFRVNSTNNVLHLDSSGNAGIGAIPEVISNNKTIEVSSVASSQSANVMIRGNSSQYSRIWFADENDFDVGRIIYDHGAASANSMQFWTDNTQRVTIDGSGNVAIGTAALATSATDGFLYIPSMAGAPSGTPTDYSNLSAFVHDTTNNRLYVYDHVDGAWQYASLT